MFHWDIQRWPSSGSEYLPVGNATFRRCSYNRFICGQGRDRRVNIYHLQINSIKSNIKLLLQSVRCINNCNYTVQKTDRQKAVICKFKNSIIVWRASAQELIKMEPKLAPQNNPLELLILSWPSKARLRFPRRSDKLRRSSKRRLAPSKRVSPSSSQSSTSLQRGQRMLVTSTKRFPLREAQCSTTSRALTERTRTSKSW